MHAANEEISASWSRRLNECFLRLRSDAAAAIAETLRAGALAGGVWIERNGEKAPIDISLRPSLMDLASRGYLHHACWQIRGALRHSLRRVASDPTAAALMPLEEEEREWFERYREVGRGGATLPERIFCRLDALGSLDGPGWRKTLKFVEANFIGVGGMSYSTPAEDLMFSLLIPSIVTDADEMEFDRNADPRALLLDELLDHARAIDAPVRPAIAFLDDRSLYTLGGELGANGDVIAKGQRIDIVYRFLELGDLIDMERAGGDLRGLRAAFERNMVMPSIGGDLEHKSLFELLTSPEFTTRFEPELRHVLDEHVLWTRLLYERRTSGPFGHEIDLAPYTRRNRVDLVIKPNRLSGGVGVVIGSVASENEWHAALERALARPGTHVVQAATESELEDFPVLQQGRTTLARMYCAPGFFPGRTGLGVFGRFSPRPVVNIQAGGGISPFLVSVR